MRRSVSSTCWINSSMVIAFDLLAAADGLQACLGKEAERVYLKPYLLHPRATASVRRPVAGLRVSAPPRGPAESCDGMRQRSASPVRVIGPRELPRRPRDGPTGIAVPPPRGHAMARAHRLDARHLRQHLRRCGRV